MVASGAQTVEQYLAELPAERRRAIAAVRQVILRNLPAGFEEGMQYGMIGYRVPLSRYPDTYNGQPLTVVSLGSQKRYMALYLTAAYGDTAWRQRLVEAFRSAGKRLDMGRSCLRFGSLDDLPLEVIGDLVAATGVEDFIATYEASRSASAPREKAGASSTARAAAARPVAPTPARAGAQKHSVTAKPAARRASVAARAVKPAAIAKPSTRRAAGPSARAAATALEAGARSGKKARSRNSRKTRRGAP